jgi:hypothetical protein
VYFLIVFDEFDHILKNSFEFFILSLHVLYFLFNEVFMVFDFSESLSVSLVNGLSAFLKLVILMIVERLRCEILLIFFYLDERRVGELKESLVLIELSIKLFDNKFLYFKHLLIMF